MKRYWILCFSSLMFQLLTAQSIDELAQHFSGKLSWDAAQQTLTFQQSGTIHFPQRDNLMDFRWDVPTEVTKIIIKKGVQVTGFFHLFNHTLIEGEDRATSILYGTDEAGLLNKRGLDKEGPRAVPYSALFAKGDIVIRVQNLTVLNPFSFMFTGKADQGGHSAVFHLYQVSGIDNRGGHSNHSDGVSAGNGTTVRDCYFECGDDVIKVYQDIYVENTTIKMIKNTVPIQLGWHNNSQQAIGVFRNLKIIGDLGRQPTGNAIINARNGRYDKTLLFDGLTVENPNATLLDLWNNDHDGVKGGGHLTIRIDDVQLQVGQFQKRWNMEVDMEICGQKMTQEETRTRMDCQIPKAIESHEKAVHVMDDWMRDPYITIGPDGKYYLTCTQQINETNSIGAPVWTSDDLASWTFQGFPYAMKDASNFEAFVQGRAERNAAAGNAQAEQPLRLWAPEFHFVKGRWVVVHTSNAGIGNLATTRGKTLHGLWTDWGAQFGSHHDPSIFTDTDSSLYLVSKCTEIVKIKADLSGFEEKAHRLEPANRKMGHEGAFILKIENKYVLFGTAWSTDEMRHGTYNLYYCTADSLMGPYGPRQFAGRFLGHGTLFKDKAGRWWCTAFYNANQPVLDGKEAAKMDLSDTAYTINKQGLTLVPMEVEMIDGELVIYPKDEDYRYPGAEEVQHFSVKK